MTRKNADNIQDDLDLILRKLDSIENYLHTPGGGVIHHINKARADIINALARHDYYNYSQIESFLKLSFDGVFNYYPPFRGWALSPDLALVLRDYIIAYKPNKIIEFGCGASTVVLAKALRDAGKGSLVSIENSNFHAAKTQKILDENFLSSWVEIIVSEIIDNDSISFNSKENVKFKWYDAEVLKKEGVLNYNYDLVLVDGPPGAICKNSRYPALPFLINNLSDNAVIYLDDARREDEREISEKWSSSYSFNNTFLNLDKGASLFERR